MTRAEYKTDPDKIKIKDLIKLFNEYFLQKRNVPQMWRTLLDQTVRNRNTKDFWRKIIEIEEDCAFEGITAEDLLISKYMTATTDTKH